MPDLKENAYTVVESTTHSIAVDILTSPSANIGTLFVSSSEGTYFVEALADTNRNEYGIVDFEELVGLEGVGIANIVANREEVVGWGETKKLKSKITYDDGSSWRFLKAPEKHMNGDDWACDREDTGSILVIVDDEESTDHVHYSYDGGVTWTKLDLGVTVRGLILVTVPDSTSQK
ncbi:hypothetical protein IAU60_004558 [Kwoniella sp. DSM 27419]